MPCIIPASMPVWGRSPPGGGKEFYTFVIGGLAIAMAG